MATIKKKSMIAYACENVQTGNTPPLLVGVQTCIDILEISMMVSQKISNQSTSRPSNTTLGNIPKGYIIPQRHAMFISVLFVIARTYNAPQPKIMEKENEIHLHNGVLLSSNNDILKLAGK